MKASRVIITCAVLEGRGRTLADRLGLPLSNAPRLEAAKAREVERYLRSQVEISPAQSSFVFLLSGEGLSLVQITEQSLLGIRADFYSPSVTYRRQKGGGKGQMIAKAVGLGSGRLPTVLDATAGLGSDAFVLASLGCPVNMLERVPEVRALLSDGLVMAREWGQSHDGQLLRILDRMQLIGADAASYLPTVNDDSRPDVVYLDPMFPLRSKSAQVKKEMHVFHSLVGTDLDADNLLDLALACARKRVVVKRPRIAPGLAASKPSYQLEGKSNRFDVYLCG